MTRSNEVSLPGTLVAISGIGVLLTGNPGASKSDTALELVNKGHKFIADDSVIIRREKQQLIGSCPEVGKKFIYLQGPGIVNIEKHFGKGAVASKTPLNIIVELMDTSPETVSMDETMTQKILEVDLPYYRIPSALRRNSALLIETIVQSFQLAKKGYNALEDFKKRQREFMD